MLQACDRAWRSVQRMICAACPLNVAYDSKYANSMPEFGMLVWY